MPARSRRTSEMVKRGHSSFWNWVIMLLVVTMRMRRKLPQMMAQRSTFSTRNTATQDCCPSGKRAYPSFDRMVSETKSPARWPGLSDETLALFIVPLHRGGCKRRDERSSDFAPWCAEEG